MFVEFLFKFPGVEVINKSGSHYQVWIALSKYKKLVPKFQKIFWENFDKLQLLQRSKKDGKILLIVYWVRDVDEDEDAKI